MRLTYDQPVVTIGPNPWTPFEITIDGQKRDGVALFQPAADVLDITASVFGFPLAGRFVDYTPPPSTVESTGGVPAATQSGVPIPP